MKKLFENLPMTLNLGMPQRGDNYIGIAEAERDEETGETHLHIRIDPETSERLGDLIEVFELKAIGFAGVARRPRT